MKVEDGILDLSNQNLTSIPEEVFSLKEVIVTLDLSQNQITSIPPKISQLKDLINIQKIWERVKKKKRFLYLKDKNLGIDQDHQ